MAEEQKQAGLVVPEEDKGFSPSNMISNVPKDLLEYGKQLVHAFTPSNIPQTIQGMGEVGRGTIYNVTGYNPPHMGEPMPDWAVTPVQKMQARRMGYGEDPAQVQREKEVAGSMGERVIPLLKYTREGGYQGLDPEAWKTFGKHLEEEPVGTLSLNAPFFGGVGGGIGKVAGAGSRIAETANLPAVADALNLARSTGNIIEKGKYLDPATAGFGVLESTGKGIANAASNLSGVQEFQPIIDLYAKGGKEGKIARNAFEEFSSGQGDYNSFLKQLNNEIETVHKEKLADWAKRKGDLQNNPIPLDDVEAEMINVTGNKVSRRFAGDQTRKAIDYIEQPGGLLDRLSELKNLPDTDPSRKLFGVDQYKQSLWDEIVHAKKNGNQALVDVLNPVYKKVTEVMSKYGDSEYANLMDDYQNIVSEMRDLQTASGSTKPSVSQFRTILSSRKNPVGRSILDDIVKRNPYLEGAFLGDIHLSTAKPFKPNLFDVGAIPAAAFAQYYHPYGAAGVAALEMGRLGLRSPTATTGVAKTLGAIERNPVTASAKSIIEAAPTAVKKIAPFQSSMESAYKERLEQRQEKEAEERLKKFLINRSGDGSGEGGPLQVTVPVTTQPKPQQAFGGRLGRDTGGRTNTSAASKAARLIARVDHIRKGHGKDTSALLNLDDDTVAKALSIANQKI